MEERKLNILIVHNYYKQSGGEGVVVENEKIMLENNGHNIVLYTKNNNEIDNYNIFQKLLLPFKYLFNINTYFDIKRILQKEKIDIIHVHNINNIISKSVYYAALKRNVPIVQTIHNFRFLCPNGILYRNDNVCEECINNGLKCAIKYKCYRNSLLETILAVINIKQMRKSVLFSKMNFICLTEFNKNKLLELNNICKKQLIKEENVYIKPNFVLDNDICNINKKRGNYYVYASRLDSNKGIKFLLEAWRNIKDTKLYVCGAGELEKWCKKYLSDHHINNVILKGNVKHDKLMKLLSESKGLIYPTKVYEGMPMSIIEAYSVGTPVIVPDFGNAGSLVVNGITGYKYKYNDIESFVDSYTKINKCNLYDNVFKEYIKKYTQRENMEYLINIYYNVLKKQNKE